MHTSKHDDHPAGIVIRHTLKPGDVGNVIRLHGILYGREYGWDCTFEAYVAAPLAKFVKAPHPRQRIWIVEKEGRMTGCIAVAQASAMEAQIRWLLLHPDLRGLGIGKRLVAHALDFCRQCEYRSVMLWTEKRLTPAIRLYESFGFRLTEEKSHPFWGDTVTEQRFIREV